MRRFLAVGALRASRHRRTILRLSLLFVALYFVVGWVQSSIVSEIGAPYLVVQCVFKSVASIHRYSRTLGANFSSVSSVIESAPDWRRGYFGTTFPTDKATVHSYTRAYDVLFAPYLQRPVAALEIGIKKGGFIRVLRELLSPSSRVFGVDVDLNVPTFPLDSQIKIVAPLDSTNCVAVHAAFQHVSFDVIIDDGLHTDNGIFRTFECFHAMLHPTGVYVIEDSYGFDVASFRSLEPTWRWRRFPDVHPVEQLVVGYPKDSLAWAAPIAEVLDRLNVPTRGPVDL